MKSILIATMICVGVPAFAGAQDQLSAARDLYASASYEDALNLFSRVHEENATGPVADKADEYRAFCLFALGRTAEANAVAERLISANPLLNVESDASPRIVAMFTDARKRLLPGLIRDQYRTARASMDKKDYAGAEPQLVKVRTLLDEAATVNVADETLADLGVLVDGFLDLARSASAAARAKETAPVTTNVAAPAASGAAAIVRPAIFDSTAPDVTAPVVVRQVIPPLPKELFPMVELNGRSGILEIVVNEKGAVEQAVMREPTIAAYDALVLSATRGWKYQPAMKSGTPVKYVRVISIHLKPSL